jgi:hypothetical protein
MKTCWMPCRLVRIARQHEHPASDRGAFLWRDQSLDGSNALSDPDLKKNVSTEMGLHVLAYNMKRVMNILGTPNLA